MYKVKYTVLVYAGLIGSLSFSTGGAQAAINAETRAAAMNLGAKAVTELTFDQGSTNLSDAAKSDLNSIIADARRQGDISQIKVAAWADQDYPPNGVSLASDQINLAERRAEAIQNYLEQQFGISGGTIATINMAERPSGVQRMLKTPGANAKNALERSGAAPTTSGQTGFLGLKGKAAHAVVMIGLK